MKNSILSKDFFFIDQDSKTKAEVFQKALDFLVRKKRVISTDKLKKNIFYRESLGATGIGQGFAIPHGESTDVLYPTIFFIRLTQPLVWESPDSELVNQIILFVVDGVYDKKSYQIIRRIMSRLGEEDFLQEIKYSDLNEVFKIFSNIIRKEEDSFA